MGLNFGFLLLTLTRLIVLHVSITIFTQPSCHLLMLGISTRFCQFSPSLFLLPILILPSVSSITSSSAFAPVVSSFPNTQTLFNTGIFLFSLSELCIGFLIQGTVSYTVNFRGNPLEYLHKFGPPPVPSRKTQPTFDL